MIRLTLPARPENLAVIRQAIAGVAEGKSIDEQTAGDMKMAVTEACTNVILHAYERPDFVQVDIEPETDEVRIVVRDRGVGFKPDAAAEPDRPTQRLGLPLIAALTDRFEVGTPKQGSGTEVVMTFFSRPN